MSAVPPSTAPSPVANIPPLSRRLVFGGLRFVGLAIVWAVLPYEVLTRLAGLGVDSSLDLTFIVEVGVFLAALGSVRYVLKPTVAYGPIGALGSALTALYLWTLSQSASVSIAGSNQVTIALGYGTILALLAIVPIFGLAASLVTTVEDLHRPGERLPFDYPPA